MNKKNIRIAQIKAYVIKKRCRKEEYTLVTGDGYSDEEAIADFNKNLAREKQGWKSYRFLQGPITFDAIRIEYATYSTLEVPLIPTSRDNIKSFEIQE